MSTRLIEAIIPVYLNDNSLYPIVERCLGSFNDFYPEIQVRVINDGSPLHFPEDWLDCIDIYHTYTDNRGYTKAINQGLQSSDADIMIICNDDIEISVGQLDRFYEMKGKMIASPSDTASSPDDKFGSIWGITRAAYSVLGPLNESYVHFFSDTDYYERAKAAGIEVVKWYDITIDHMESATYKTVDKDKLFAKDLETYERDRAN